MPARQDPRTSKWYFRKQVRLHDGSTRSVFKGGFATMREAEIAEAKAIVEMRSPIRLPDVRRGKASTVSDEKPGQVYFIGHDAAIKIGFTAEMGVHARMATLQVGNHLPLRIFACFTGTEQHEVDLHRRFSHLHIRGEWFWPAADLIRFIESINGSCP